MRTVARRDTTAVATLGLVDAGNSCLLDQSGVPQFAPFTIATKDGKELESVWFRNMESELMLSSFNTKPSFLYLPNDYCRMLADSAESICQLQAQSFRPSDYAQYNEKIKAVFASTYSTAMTSVLRPSDISLHLKCEKVLIGSKIPSKESFRIFLDAQHLHTKSQKESKVVLDITPEFMQDLVNSYTSLGGTFLLRGGFQCGNGHVIHHQILREDL